MMAESKNDGTRHNVGQVTIGIPPGTKGAGRSAAEAASRTPPIEKSEQKCVVQLRRRILENSGRSHKICVRMLESEFKPDNCLAKKSGLNLQKK